MNGLELFENMLRSMEETTIDDFKTSISESTGSNNISEDKIRNVYNRYMEAVKQIRKEADERNDRASS